jgi:sugar lactone lactonase YvrE
MRIGYRLRQIIFIFFILSIGSTTIKAQIINTIIGNGIAGYSGDGGQAINAELNTPNEIVADNEGNIFVSDRSNNRIRKINTLGTISTFAGNGSAGFSGDGGQATNAEIYLPTGMVLDQSGNLFFSDEFNNRIRMINSIGIITTVIGIGTPGFSGDGGQATAAEIYQPYGLTFDNSGNLYFSDTYNQRVRKVNSNGIISTIAGNGIASFSGDGGQATSASIHSPFGLTIDEFDNLYIADRVNNCIRKVNTLGIISTIAGNGTQGFSGDGGQSTLAELHYPSGINFDALGNLYVTDVFNMRIRMINTVGIITTIAGNGTQGFNGDGGPAIVAELNYPLGLAFDVVGNLFFTDESNNRVRVVNIAENTTDINRFINSNEQVIIYPNPNTGKFKLIVNGHLLANVQIEVYNTLGEKVYQYTNQQTSYNSTIDLSSQPSGVYFINISMGSKQYTKKIIKN